MEKVLTIISFRTPGFVGEEITMVGLASVMVGVWSL